MKYLFKVTICVLTSLLMAAPNRYAQGDEGLRARFSAEPSVTALYTVDDTHSFIVGALPKGAGGFTITSRYAPGPAQPVMAYMIEHAPEPVVYKNPVVPGYRDAAGPGGAGGPGGLPGRLPLEEESLGAYRVGYTAVDLYQHAYASCTRGGGTLNFVVPKKYGNYKRLTRVGATEAFDYMLVQGDGGAWYMACEGEARFLVLKNYSFLTGGVEVAEVTLGRGLEGVSYAKDERTAADRIAGIAAMGKRPLTEEKFLEETAREVAFLKMSFVKPFNGERYMAVYGKPGPGCEVVTINRLKGEEKTVATAYDFKVCADKVARTGVRETGDGPATPRERYALPGKVVVVRVAE